MSTQHTKPVEIIRADLNRFEHQSDVLSLIDAYSRDPFGDGKPLCASTRDALIQGLREHPTTLIFLAYSDAEAIGIAVCFRGFSTFSAKPLLNIHDLAVLPQHRARGVGRQLISAIENYARTNGCCKLTLEVQENNLVARRTYESAGFARAVYQPEAGATFFYTKPLKA